MCELLDLTFLGNIPIDPTFVEMIESQDNEEIHGKKKLIHLYDDSELKPIMNSIIDKVLEKNLPSRI